MAKEPAAVSPSDEVLLKKIQEEGDGKAQDILLARYKDCLLYTSDAADEL